MLESHAYTYYQKYDCSNWVLFEVTYAHTKYFLNTETTLNYFVRTGSKTHSD